MYVHADESKRTKKLLYNLPKLAVSIIITPRKSVNRGQTIAPLSLTRFWHRRLSEAVVLLSLGIVALYVVPLYFHVGNGAIFGVTLAEAIIAGAAIVASVVTYFLPFKKETFWPSLIVFLLFAAAVSGLIVETGGTSSPFIALWLLAGFFAAIFGLWGVLPLLAAIGALLGYEYLKGNFTPETVTVAVFSGLLPIIAGLIVWHNSVDRTSENKDYKHLANELSEVATKSEVVINAIGDGVIAIDAQGNIQLINPAAQALLGWSKQDALMLNYKSVLHLLDQRNNELQASSDPIQQVLNDNQQRRSNDFVVLTKSSKKLSTSLVISPIGQPGSGVIVVFRDITAEKAAAREQSEFISTASHEMRTPVASIEGYLGLALNPQTSQIDAKARDFIMKAHESAQHLGNLFQDLLDVSKADDMRLSNNPKVIDLTQFVHDIVIGLDAKATAKGLQLVYVPIPKDAGEGGVKHIAPVYYVNLDNDHIREIVDNLVENAIKYTPAGQVTVDVNGTDDKVTVSIKDSGIGIPAEDIPHLFQKFYRVDDPETRQIGGTGLGLYLCRKLAETMGGRIWLESVYQQGSTFYLELPRISNQQAVEIKAEQERNAAAEAARLVTAPAAPIAPVFQPSPSQPVPPAVAPAAMAAPVTAPTPPPGIQPAVQPATSVPRGEALTREQIAAKVAQLEAMAKAQQAQPTNPAPPPAPQQ